ncbi:MAG: butyrate kinase [Firmicutes bacterium]|nr:butyrate kinase [Bacillota bacterium]
MSFKLLIMNLGSTSTKVSVYEDYQEVARESLHHSQEQLNQYPSPLDQKEFRKEAILKFLSSHDYDLKDFSCIVARGGCCKPIEGGIYRITKEMLDDIASEKYGLHISNTGCFIAYELGQEYDLPVITADTVKTDEFFDLARYSGHPLLPRVSTMHALNQKATARRYAAAVGRSYDDLNLIVAHLGGGISVGAHCRGRVIDTNNGLDGDGPFSPERAGTLPVGALIDLCFSGDYSHKEVRKMINGKGGIMAYLGTNSGLEVEDRISHGDQDAAEVYEAMAYQVSREIGAASATLKGDVNAILLTGSLAYSKTLTDWIKDRVQFIAPVVLYPGENEMLSLAESGMRWLKGEEALKTY